MVGRHQPRIALKRCRGRHAIIYGHRGCFAPPRLCGGRLRRHPSITYILGYDNMLASLVKAHQDAPSEREGRIQRAPTATFQVKPVVAQARPSLLASRKRNETHVERRGAAVQQNASSDRSVKAHPSILTGNRPGNCQGNERRCAANTEHASRGRSAASPLHPCGVRHRRLEPVRRRGGAAAQSHHHVDGADAPDHRARHSAHADFRAALPRG